jgi:tetratricopeptide (TPR) repeat protein
MLATKNITRCGITVFLTLAVFLTGCGPPGPRALLKGEKLLVQGDYSDAVEKLKLATSLMSTNAQAWNYLGVAYQHAGQPADAALAYQRALTLDRDLVEAHYNFGCLWLEQNKPDVARTEFTAYVLRRSRAPEGWTKLGVAQLRLRDLASAEKSFSTALALDTNNAEALNGLGLAQVQRGRPREAVQYFAAANRAQPDYAPALLNLATMARQYLRDNALALQKYRAYLALTPHRADWDQVNTLANDLEQQMNGAAASVPSNVQHAQRTATSTWTPSSAGSPSQNEESQSSSTAADLQNSSTAEENSYAPAETPPRPGNGQPRALSPLNPMNWFRGTSPEPKAAPLPSSNSNSNPVKPAPKPEASNLTAFGTPMHTQSKPFRMVQPAPPAFPQYLYLSPARPGSGDRQAAGRAFAQAQQFERDRQYLDALNSYRAAADLDPGWFEAQYNSGVMAYRLGNFDQALPAYEMALAIQPDSADARYNFALALKAAGYVPDAVNELRKLLASNPGDVRAHLALGNLYAQQLYDVPRARAQYSRVLQLDPRNSQAADIQFWLSSNPP